MYFSVITPQAHLLRQAAHQLAQSSYAEHQWLWQFFPSSKDQLRDFLFRRQDIDRVPRFYVVSQREPVGFSEAWQVQSRAYDPQLTQGQHLAFELRVNPVVTKKDAMGKSYRHDVVMQAKKTMLAGQGVSKWREWSQEEGKPQLYDLVQQTCMEWLASRAEKSGFSIIDAHVDAYQQVKAGQRNICFSTVDFSGVLQVTDPDLFKHKLFDGLGHAKAFGCGLLLVKRAEN